MFQEQMGDALSWFFHKHPLRLHKHPSLAHSIDNYFRFVITKLNWISKLFRFSSELHFWLSSGSKDVAVVVLSLSCAHKHHYRRISFIAWSTPEKCSKIGTQLWNLSISKMLTEALAPAGVSYGSARTSTETAAKFISAVSKINGLTSVLPEKL